MSGTVLLTLGRLPKALDIARGFAALGWRVLVAEPFAWHLARPSRAVARSLVVTAPAESREGYLRDLAGIVAREAVDLVVPVSEETMHVAHLPPFLPGGVRVFTMPPEVVLPLHDKGGFARQARALGLAVPDTRALDEADAAALVAEGDVVVKPVFSCSGRGLRILPRGAALPAPDPAAPAIVQRFVAGRVHSSCSVAWKGRALATAFYRGTTMSGSVAVGFERVEDRALAAWTDAFIAGTGYSGFISFDFVVDAEGRPHGIECNPRATSGLHFLEPADLARAIAAPDDAPPPRFRPEARLQQFYACLTETQNSIRDLARFRANLAQLTGTRDVTWSARDPLPFLTMPFTSWRIIRMALQRGVPFGEVATLDIGWDGPAPAPRPVTAGSAAPSAAASSGSAAP